MSNFRQFDRATGFLLPITLKRRGARFFAWVWAYLAVIRPARPGDPAERRSACAATLLNPEARRRSLAQPRGSCTFWLLPFLQPQNR